ncbi:MAG: hypothetical protein ABH821_05830 [archaeon]
MNFNLYAGNYKRLLILPIILFVVFGFLIFVYPGLDQGIDLKGGTSIILRSDTHLDAVTLEQLLNENFNLSDLQVNTVSGLGSEGTIIQFAENLDLSEAEQAFRNGKEVIDSSPVDARNYFLSTLTLLSINLDLAPSDLQELREFTANSLSEARNNFSQELQGLLISEFNLGEDLRLQMQEVGPALGESFWDNAMLIGVVGFILIVFVIFFFFREIVPSIAILLAAAFDISAAVALMALFNVPLGLTSIPALLMLIGYSVDTDIMLTSRLLKRSAGTAKERAVDAMKTGLTMTFTTMAAVSVMLILSFYTQMLVMFFIAAVLLFGLIGDLVSTWFMNTPILLWYVERKKKVVS